MRINAAGRPVRSAALRPPTSGGGFVVPAGEDDMPSLACEQTVPASATSAILVCSATAGENVAVADREARRHGEAVLDALRVLQQAQLRGDPQSSLAGLAKLAAMGATASDPGLQEVMQAIAARAAIELARWQ